MPAYILFRTFTTGSTSGGQKFIRYLWTDAEVQQAIKDDQQKLGEDLTGFERTDPGGTPRLLGPDGKHTISS
jgi:hypothetical protein